MQVWIVECWECGENSGTVSVWTTEGSARADAAALTDRGKFLRYRPTYSVSGPCEVDRSFGFEEAEDES